MWSSTSAELRDDVVAELRERVPDAVGAEREGRDDDPIHPLVLEPLDRVPGLGAHHPGITGCDLDGVGIATGFLRGIAHHREQLGQVALRREEAVAETAGAAR